MATHDRRTRRRHRSRLVRVIVSALSELIVVGVLLYALPGIGAAAGPRFRLPLAPPAAVVRGFDPPELRWQPGHRGVDLSTSPGAAIRAAGPGTVQFAGVVAGRPVVSIHHADGLITTYEPVRPSVRAGATVRRGQTIGTVSAGHEGCSAPACLHWGARRGKGRSAVYLNPLALIGALRVRLKPVDGVRPVDVPAGEPHAAVPH
ncbi:peptidoglycan DD-metalloendopeptidase family protein [Gordonia sp. SID5947]|uniref:murein hydrolase activator EnvC family protein n=1 Tax=Gordonia sp. SID5947 TaxID=2690315 RepID=UPI00136AC9D2|nr:M23 family metallopeptidase [Gordonia sp. SID5947]MYR05928.1 peptidoglycan DD-metalloendopeptidase family protein [Gordonia sp. SID5947]